MLNEIINYIDAKLSDIGYMPDPKGLVEKHNIDGKEIPSSFCKGEWIALNVEDEFTYHRIVGTINVSEVDEEQTISCDVYQEKTYPMRLVFCKKRSKVNNSIFDNSSVGDDISNSIAALNVQSLCKILKADTIQIQPEDIEVNTTNAFADEFGLEEVPLDYIFIYVNYNLIITGTVSCFKNLCQLNAQ